MFRTIGFVAALMILAVAVCLITGCTMSNAKPGTRIADARLDPNYHAPRSLDEAIMQIPVGGSDKATIGPPSEEMVSAAKKAAAQTTRTAQSRLDWQRRHIAVKANTPDALCDGKFDTTLNLPLTIDVPSSVWRMAIWTAAADSGYTAGDITVQPKAEQYNCTVINVAGQSKIALAERKTSACAPCGVLVQEIVFTR